jgi:hypothetical protein
MFESGVRRARAVDACGRDAAGVLQAVRRAVAQSIAAAGAAFANADAGKLPADGAPALIVSRDAYLTNGSALDSANSPGCDVKEKKARGDLSRLGPFIRSGLDRPSRSKTSKPVE